MLMKIRKRITAVLSSVLALMMFLPAQVLAAGNIDLNHDVSLTISYHDGETPLVGAGFDIYLVATVDENGELTPTEDFKQFDVNIRGKNDDAWRKLASTLEGYVLRDGIAPADSGETDDRGILVFPNNQEPLQQGLYLVLGQRHEQDGMIYEASPFMVMLPGLDQDANAWVYDVMAEPKYDFEPVSEEPETITRKVLKVWKDEGHEKERPQEILVQLLQDDKVFDTVTLSADNGWRYTWNNLDSACQWTVVEKEVENYSTVVTREGVTFVVTNTFEEDEPDESNPPKSTIPPTNPDKPDKPDLPQTGQLWWPVPVMFAAGLMLIIIGLLIRRRGAGHEK